MQHIDPAEAVQVHLDVQSRRSVGMHCCTFCLTDEAMDEPPALLRQHVKEAALPSDSFVTLRHGGRIVTSDGADVHVAPLL